MALLLQALAIAELTRIQTFAIRTVNGLRRGRSVNEMKKRKREMQQVQSKLESRQRLDLIQLIDIIIIINIVYPVIGKSSLINQHYHYHYHYLIRLIRW